MKRNIGLLLIIFGVLIILYVVYTNSNVSHETRTFSIYTVLSSSWEKYKLQFLNKDGRIVDPSQNFITTSEGQSYALLRAVWLDDKATFDLVWKWTKDNMKRKDDHLFGWKWGKDDSGSYGFIEDGGGNSAADADSDIALALIFAGERWNSTKYTEDAKNILKDLWSKETAVAAGKRYLIAGNWANTNDQIVVNPSYFAPYAWRIFAKVDNKHDWNSLIDPAYVLLETATKDPLNKSSSANLPPNWVSIEKQSGKVTAGNIDNLTTDYSFDAIRVPWRIAVDYLWNNEAKAAKYLQSNFQIIADSYSREAKLPTVYAHNGAVLDGKENPAMYATILGYFIVTDKNTAKKIYEDKVIKLYSNDINSFDKDIPYYEQNWLWFGTALYNNQLKPLI